jgi:hypothetical protein
MSNRRRILIALAIIGLAAYITGPQFVRCEEATQVWLSTPSVQLFYATSDGREVEGFKKMNFHACSREMPL